MSVISQRHSRKCVMVAFVCECGFRAELSAEQCERLAATGGRVKCPNCGKSAKVSQSNPTNKVIDASVDDRGVDLESSGSTESGGPSRPAWLNRRPSDNEDEFDGIKNKNAGTKLDGFSDDEILNALSESKQDTSNPTERITCRFCGEVILAVAQKCKHCGEFLDEDRSQRENLAPVVPRQQNIPITILVEQTSKSWKRIQVQGILGTMLGLFMFFFALLVDTKFIAVLATFGVIGSLCWWLIGRIGAWWDHG